MPEPSKGSPDYHTGQVWFMVDYGGEFDRLAFAIRGGRIQDILAQDYKQRTPPSPKLGPLARPVTAPARTSLGGCPSPSSRASGCAFASL